MTWVRYDDNVANHPKVAPLDDAPYRLWREALEWSAHNLTDGVIRTHQLLVTSTRANKGRAGKLVAAGLWHLAGTRCDSPKCPPSGEDGWVIHDYWDYQPTRAKVRAEQSAKAERQRRWLDGKRNGSKGTSGDGPKDASHDVSGDGVRDGIIDATPAPPRPAPKGRAGADAPAASAARRAAAEPADGGREEDPSVAHPLGPEDPEALAREQAEIAADAEAKVRAFDELARRSERGAAAARAALAAGGRPKPTRANGLAALREATPTVAVQLTEPDPTLEP